MARQKSIDLVGQLEACLNPKLCRELGKATGAFKRIRKVEPHDAIWSLVWAVGFGPERTIASSRRALNRISDKTVVPSSMSDRFTPEFARFMAAAFAHVIRERAHAPVLEGPFKALADIAVVDTTLLRLRDLLADAFPGSRTNHSKAALKLHAVMSATSGGAHTVKLTSGRASDVQSLVVGRWVKARLLLFDRAYYSYPLFEAIRLNGGYFVTRLKANVDPTITSVANGPLSAEGCRLREVLANFKSQVLDVDARADYHRASSKRWIGARKSGTFRFVGIRDPLTGSLWLYATNLPRGQFSAESVGKIYSARWAIEVMFQSLKHDLCLDHLRTTKPAALEAFVYASMIAWAVTTRLRGSFAAALSKDSDRATLHRWARLVRTYASDLLVIAAAPRSRRAKETAAALERALRAEGPDPHRRRRYLLQRAQAQQEERLRGGAA